MVCALDIKDRKKYLPGRADQAPADRLVTVMEPYKCAKSRWSCLGIVQAEIERENRSKRRQPGLVIRVCQDPAAAICAERCTR